MKVEIACAACAQPFAVDPWMVKRRTYCSHRCAQAKRNQSETVTAACPGCGDSFTYKRQPSQPYKKFCGKSCYYEWKSNQSFSDYHPDYKRQLDPPDWNEDGVIALIHAVFHPNQRRLIIYQDAIANDPSSGSYYYYKETANGTNPALDAEDSYLPSVRPDPEPDVRSL